MSTIHQATLEAMMALDKMRMAREHEDHIAKTFGARSSPGSGSKFNNPADIREDHTQQEFAFAFECKSTRALSFSLTRAQWDKIGVQSHAERPAIPIRFYLDDRCTQFVDLVLVGLDDFQEMHYLANGFDHGK